jgi:hypothetical protein
MWSVLRRASNLAIPCPPRDIADSITFATALHREERPLSWLKRAWAWLKWPVALLILGWLFYQNRNGLSQLREHPKNWWLLAVAFALCFGSTLLTFFRWHLLVFAQGFEFRIQDALRLGFVGLIANYVLPLGAVGGDVTKAVLLAREQVSRRSVAVATVLLDRILGLLALFLLGALASLLPSQLPRTSELQVVQFLLWGGSLAGLFGLGVMLHPASLRWRWLHSVPRWPVVGRRLAELLHGVELYQSRPSAVVAAVVISLFGHLGLILSFYCCARALLPWSPDLIGHYFFMPPAETFGAFFPTPGGMGGLEGAVQWFYERLAPTEIGGSVAAAGGLLATLAFRIVGLAVAAVGTVYYVSARADIERVMKQPPADQVCEAPASATLT